jgi:hypothetical protein
MTAFVRWIQAPIERLSHVMRPSPASARAATDEVSDDAATTIVKCPSCDGTGLCRVCGGEGRIDRLMPVAGGDPIAMGQEPVHKMQTVKCRACPSSSGTCKTCKGTGKVRVPSAE